LSSAYEKWGKNKSVAFLSVAFVHAYAHLLSYLNGDIAITQNFLHFYIFKKVGTHTPQLLRAEG